MLSVQLNDKNLYINQPGDKNSFKPKRQINVLIF